MNDTNFNLHFASFVLSFFSFLKDANSRKQEAEWKEKAIKELDEWYARQDEQLQKTKANNRSVGAVSCAVRSVSTSQRRFPAAASFSGKCVCRSKNCM